MSSACIAHDPMIEWAIGKEYAQSGVVHVQLGPNANMEDSRIDSANEGALPESSMLTDGQPSEPAGWLDRMRAEDSMIPNLLLMVGMIVLVFVMFRSLRKTHKANAQRTNSLGSPSERIEEIRQHAQSSMDPAQRLMVDAEDIARRLGAVLDNKAARLELLIEEADAKLDQLNRAVSGQARPQQTHSSEPGESNPTRPAIPPRSIDPSLMDRARLEQDQHERESRIAGRIQPEQVAQDEPETEISISDRIHELALRGKSSQEIAQELKQPVGQVELILNLRKRAEQP